MTGAQKSPDEAAMGRRAAALFLHSRRTTLRTEGILAILDEMDDLDEFEGGGGAGDLPWVALVMSLLSIGNEMTRAALDDAVDEYLESVVQMASLDEAARGEGA